MEQKIESQARNFPIVSANNTPALSVEERRRNVLRLHSFGLPITKISQILGCGVGTVHRDLKYIKNTVEDTISIWITENTPFYYERMLARLDAINEEAYAILKDANSDPKIKLVAINVLKELLLVEGKMIQENANLFQYFNNLEKDADTIFKEKRERQRRIYGSAFLPESPRGQIAPSTRYKCDKCGNKR